MPNYTKQFIDLYTCLIKMQYFISHLDAYYGEKCLLCSSLCFCSYQFCICVKLVASVEESLALLCRLQ